MNPIQMTHPHFTKLKKFLNHVGVKTIAAALAALPALGVTTAALASAPAVVIQFRNITSPTGCLGAFERAGLDVLITGAMTASLTAAGEANPQPDVRAAGCVSGRETFGMWPKPVGAYGASDTDSARNSALSGVSILTPTETFAVRIPAAGLDRAVKESLDERRTVNDAGEPDPNGANHLDSHTISFSPTLFKGGPMTNYVRTTIEGHRETWPADIDFDVDLWDYLWLENGQVRCSSAEPELTVTSAWVQILKVVSLGFTGGLLFAIEADYTMAIGDQMSTQMGDGPACAASAAIPQEILLPGSYCSLYFNGICYGRYAMKMVMSYSRLAVTSEGITTAGTYTQQVRQPAAWVHVEGSEVLIRSDEPEFSAVFFLLTDDLRRAFQSVTWSAPGATITPFGGGVRVTWTVPLSTAALYTQWGLAKSVSVSVRDADGLVASDSLTVHLKHSFNPDLPPICDSQPNHYECNVP